MIIIIISGFVIFFMPGYIWSYIFIPRISSKKRESLSRLNILLASIERFFLSIVLSIVLVVTSIYISTALLNVAPTLVNSWLIVTILSIVGVFLLKCYSPHIIDDWVTYKRRFLNMILKLMKLK